MTNKKRDKQMGMLPKKPKHTPRPKLDDLIPKETKPAVIERNPKMAGNGGDKLKEAAQALVDLVENSDGAILGFGSTNPLRAAYEGLKKALEPEGEQ